MPVGQAVTATRLRTVAVRRRRPRRPVLGGRRGRGAAAAAAVRGGRRAAARRATDLVVDEVRPPRRVVAAAQGVGEVVLHQRAGELGQQLEVVASPPAGAAIRKARSAGPSLAPKSTAGRVARTRASAPRPRWCGSAGSRCRRAAPSARWPHGPARPRRAGPGLWCVRRRRPRRRGRDHLQLVGAQGGVEPTRSRGDHLGLCGS